MTYFFKIFLFSFALFSIYSCNNNVGNKEIEKSKVSGVLDTVAIYKNCMDITHQWLKLVDNRDVENSYSLTSEAFKKTGSLADWQVAVNSFETVYGELKNRQLLGINMNDNLPKAPKGLYVIINFVTESEKAGTIKERIILGRDNNFEWNIMGYFPE